MNRIFSYTPCTVLRVGLLEKAKLYVGSVVGPSEYTQSGNGRFFGIHSIMMEKLAQDDEGGGCTLPPFTIVTISYKVAVFAPVERADTRDRYSTFPLFYLYQYMYSVGGALPPHDLSFSNTVFHAFLPTNIFLLYLPSILYPT
jgi:hypothetical protein